MLTKSSRDQIRPTIHTNILPYFVVIRFLQLAHFQKVKKNFFESTQLERMVFKSKQEKNLTYITKAKTNFILFRHITEKVNIKIENKYE